MAINSPLNIAAQPGKTRLRKSLKLWQVVMMGLAYLTPMTVFDTFGIVSGISDGHVPASYLLALAEKAAQLVSIEWQELPVITTPEAALAVYRALLTEGVSLRDIVTIATVLVASSAVTKDHILLAADVRLALRRSITHPFVRKQELTVYTSKPKSARRKRSIRRWTIFLVVYRL